MFSKKSNAQWFAWGGWGGGGEMGFLGFDCHINTVR